MKIKVSEATGIVLDWMVAKCGEGLDDADVADFLAFWGTMGNSYRYSSDWAQGGPIIEREEMTVFYEEGWKAYCSHGATHNLEGHTPLEAAMRCYVSSKLGDEVEVPDEIV